MADKVKVAIVGCGGMGTQQTLSFLKVPDAEIVAICDIKPENMAKLHKEHLKDDPKIKRYDSLAALLKSPPEGLRGIVLVTPHTLHFEQSIAALDAGFDVLVEKPMVTKSEHARTLKEKVDQTGRKFLISFQSTYSQEFAYAREQLKSGGIGELQTVLAYSCQGWYKGCKGSWRHDPALSGGGQMYDTGAHLFNSLAWLLDRPATDVYCILDKKDVPVDINAVMTIKWEGGILGSVMISGNTPGWQQGIWLCGDKGRIRIGIHGGPVEQYDEKGDRVLYPQVTQKHWTPQSNFVAVIKGEAEPCCPVRYGILHSWLMDALYESAAKGTPIKLTKAPL
jgi:predicted dehydrogenase